MIELQWKDTELNKMTWDEAKKLEKDGWRLPTRGALIDSYDSKASGFLPNYYWSSIEVSQHNQFAWYVDFLTGDTSDRSKMNHFSVRLCRNESKKGI